MLPAGAGQRQEQTLHRLAAEQGRVRASSPPALGAAPWQGDAEGPGQSLGHLRAPQPHRQREVGTPRCWVPGAVLGNALRQRELEQKDFFFFFLQEKRAAKVLRLAAGCWPPWGRGYVMLSPPMLGSERAVCSSCAGAAGCWG